MSANHTPTPAELLAQADSMFLLASLLCRAGTDERLPTVKDAHLLGRAAGLGAAGDAGSALALLVRAARSALPAEWGRENARLFEGPIACPPNETAYVRRDKGAILADLCGFYRAFGFSPTDDTGEKPDHLAVEIQFAGLLLVMLARAREAGEDEKGDVVRGALRSFATDHLGVWMSAFCRALTETARLGVHRALAAALETTWDALLARHGIELTAEERAIGPVPERGTPYECGLCEGETAN